MKTPLITQTTIYPIQRINFSIDEGLVNALTSLAHEEDVPLYTVLFTAYQILLSRHCKTDDIDVDLCVASIHRHSAIGMVISSKIDGTTSFRKLLLNVHTSLQNASVKSDTTLGGDIPLAKRLRGLHDPYFASFLNFTAGFTMDDDANSIGCENCRYIVPGQTPDSRICDLKLHLCFSETNKIEGQFLFREGFFVSDIISCFASRFKVLLAGIAKSSNRPTALLPIMRQEETDTILYEWNKTDAPWPIDKCIHHLFETQAQATPARTALIDGERHITYGELFQEVQKLAALLIYLGVGSDIPVALLLERSTETVIAIYSVLRAGGFYVPIETEWPAEHIITIMADAAPPILLTRTEYMDKISKNYDGVVLCLDNLPRHTTTHLRPKNPPMPSSAVYCFYTSGTSGKPKGVVVEHRGLVKRIQWFQDKYPLTPEDRVLNKTSYGFGISEWEYFWALPHGATLVIAAPEGHKDPEYLHSLMVQKRISVWFFVPSMLDMLLKYLSANNLNGSTFITHSFTCGEVLTSKTCSQFFKMFDARLINLYGPTEADMTYWECPRLEPGEIIEKIPIGKPVSNVKIYILDEHLQPVPVGVVGELHFGGANTARGYLNRPTLTATTFIRNPFSKGHLYKTGDMAQWLPDGNIEFLGRIDQQVKIRGFRIELGEIETILSQHSAVQETVVLAREDEPNHPLLVAYVIPKPEQTLTHSELRKFLIEKLPIYMIPSVFVKLDFLPLTDNGKVNRHALPAPDQTRPDLEYAFIPPRNPLEALLADIWCDVLSLEQVGIHDNFFELGGQSLLVVQLFTQIEHQTGRKFPLATLFQAPTIEKFAKILADEKWTSSWSSLVPIQPQGAKPPLFFVHAHGGNVVGYYNLARHLGSDQPFYGLQAQGLDGTSPTFRSIKDIAVYYIKEVRTVQSQGPYYVGGWCLGGYVALEMARHLQADGEKVGLVVMVESAHPDYPKYLPSTDLFHRYFYQIMARLDLEISNFLEVEYSKKMTYCSARIARLVHTVRLKIAGLNNAPWEPSTASNGVSQIQIQKVLEQAHSEAYQTYRPKPYKGAVAVFRAAKQPFGIYPDPTLGWGELIKSKLDLQEVPGHQIGLLIEPRVHITANKMRKCLYKAQQSKIPL